MISWLCQVCCTLETHNPELWWAVRLPVSNLDCVVFHLPQRATSWKTSISASWPYKRVMLTLWTERQEPFVVAAPGLPMWWQLRWTTTSVGCTLRGCWRPCLCSETKLCPTLPSGWTVLSRPSVHTHHVRWMRTNSSTRQGWCTMVWETSGGLS